MMAPAQKHQILEAGRAAVDPVLDVVRVAAAGRAAREAATPVARLQRPPDRGRNGAGLAPDIEDGAVGVVTHRHQRGVAGHRRDVSAETSTAPWSTSTAPARPPATGRRNSRRTAPRRAGPPGNGRPRIRDRDPRTAPASATSPSASARRCAGVTSSASRSASGKPCASRNSRSAAASSARWTTAPSSGVSRPRITTIPSSSTQVESCRWRCRDSASAAAAAIVTRRQAPTSRSTCAAVPACATLQQHRLVLGRSHAGQRSHLGVGDRRHAAWWR